MEHRKKKILFAVCAILFGILSGVVLAEFFLRLYPPDWLLKKREAVNLTRQGQKFGNTVGWSVEKADGKFVRFQPGTTFKVQYFEYDTAVEIDRWGGRIVNGNRDRRTGTLIPFLGDSFAFGIGVNDDQTFVSLLQQKTNELQYLDLGVPGCALPQQLEIIKYRHRELGSPPVYVFSFYTGNDFTDMWHYYGVPEQSGKKQERPDTLQFTDSLVYRYPSLRQSYLFEYVQQLLTNYYYDERGEAQRPQHTPWLERRPNGKVMGDPILLLAKKSRLFTALSNDYLGRALDQLKKLSEEYGFSPVFIVIPDKTQVEADILRKKVNQYQLAGEALDLRIPQEILTSALRKRNIPYFDLLSCLEGKENLYYKMDDHFTPAGHREAVKCIDSDFTRLLTESAGSRPGD